jgi:hypothetical protein
MNDKAIQNVILIMVFVGGFFISVTVYGFVLFARFLDREKLAADRFRANRLPKPPPKDNLEG